MPKKYEPTPEQLALAEERRRQRQNKAATQQPSPSLAEKGRILPREWVDLTAEAPPKEHTIRIMTWNVLAQTLVRRELFPTSDCLKTHQREHMLYNEILSHGADICCLQEVDRTEKLYPVLANAGYDWVYAAGPRKRHGCAVAFRKDKYHCVREKVIVYDDQEVRQVGTERARRGGSFRTKNIASLVALRRTDVPDDGLIIATTHLFWHPAYVYERARQAVILMREVLKFRDEGPRTEHPWPCVLAGDFNFQPSEVPYSLLTGEPLLPEQLLKLEASQVVHTTVDPTVPVTGRTTAEEEDEGAKPAESEGDPDRVIVNARAATSSDGLLSAEELEVLVKAAGTLTSAYDAGMRLLPLFADGGLTYGKRADMPDDRKGAYDPIYTSYTYYWKLSLDYIFVLNTVERPFSVVGLAKPHSKESLGDGLPMKDICGSDHVSLAVDLSWPPPLSPTVVQS